MIDNKYGIWVFNPASYPRLSDSTVFKLMLDWRLARPLRLNCTLTHLTDYATPAWGRILTALWARNIVLYTKGCIWLKLSTDWLVWALFVLLLSTLCVISQQSWFGFLYIFFPIFQFYSPPPPGFRISVSGQSHPSQSCQKAKGVLSSTGTFGFQRD